MLNEILSAVSSWILSVISVLGYGGILALMIFESANIPVPSEVIMTFSGFLASRGDFNFWPVVFLGALGNLIGSLISYYLAFYYGRRPILFLSKFLLADGHEFDRAERWFVKYGSISVFVSRLLPFVRTFISFPAGLFRVPVWKFSALTFIGCFIWSWFLTYIGYVLGENWEEFGVYFRKFDYLILGIIAIGIIYFVYKHLIKGRKPNNLEL